MISIILDDKTEEDLPFLAGVGITTSSYAVSQHNIQNSAPQSMETVASEKNLRSIKFEYIDQTNLTIH